eukprot:scaffold64163_cov38-Prasinocladus_malaysianus.AAC.1
MMPVDEYVPVPPDRAWLQSRQQHSQRLQKARVGSTFKAELSELGAYRHAKAAVSPADDLHSCCVTDEMLELTARPLKEASSLDT